MNVKMESVSVTVISLFVLGALLIDSGKRKDKLPKVVNGYDCERAAV